MIWVAWRQFRTQAVVTLGVLAAFAVLVLVTGLHLRTVYDSLGGAHCAARSDCTALSGHETVLADVLGPALLTTPALLGMFWGAPLVAREFETGTYRLAWTQSVTRRRWLSVRIALVGVAALIVAGLASWLVSWWFAPLDTVHMNRFAPSVFTARGVVAIGYAGFAFALGIATSTLIRRTLPAMTATLIAFVAARIVVTFWVRPHLLHAKAVLVSVTYGNGVGFVSSAWGVSVAPNVTPIPNAWILSSALVDRARHAISTAHLHDLLVRACPAIVAGLPQTAGAAPKGPHGPAGGPILACEQRLSHHLQQLVTYQPPSHYWPLQGLETGIFVAAALALIAITVWRVCPRSAPDRAAGGFLWTRSLLGHADQVDDQRATRPARRGRPRARAATLNERVGRGCRRGFDWLATDMNGDRGLRRSRTYLGRVGWRMCRGLAAAGAPWRRSTTTASEPTHSATGATGSRAKSARGTAGGVHHIPREPRTEAGWRARLRSVASMSAAILTVAIGLPGCGGSGSLKPAAATPARTSTTALSARTMTASAIASPSTCPNANAQAPAAGAGTPGAALPTTDPFYKWGRSLIHDAPGTILRARTIAFGDGSANTPLKTTQLLYITTDELGCRTVSVVTVFQPHKKSAASPTRLFSYQTSYDALGSQCDPSYALKAGTEGEPGLITSLANAGDTVLVADYEGENAAYGVGQLSGYQTLDAIRAAETWLGVPEASTPVGMLGYSGGAVATEFASELAPTYAPHLDIVGVAEGGIPVDLFHDLTYINHPNSPWTGQIPSYLDGLARGFDIRNPSRFYTPEGIAVANADQTQCAGTFTGLTTKQMFKPRYHDIENIPVFVRIFDQSIMSRNGTPRGPLFIANGLSDLTGDGVTVTRDVQQLAHIYCHRGVAVELHIYKGLNHSEAGTPFFAQAQTFLAQRFKNLPFRNRCANIGPGNSIAPVQVPAF